MLESLFSLPNDLVVLSIVRTKIKSVFLKENYFVQMKHADISNLLPFSRPIAANPLKHFNGRVKCATIF